VTQTYNFSNNFLNLSLVDLCYYCYFCYYYDNCIDFINVSQDQLEVIVKNYFEPILHPYISQVISNRKMQAGLPPVTLQPFQPVVDKDKMKLNVLENIVN
jgi:hypothetical protein